jgi:hypothetical protein
MSKDDALALIAKNGPRKPGDCVYVGLAANAVTYGALPLDGLSFLADLPACLGLLSPLPDPLPARPWRRAE